MKLSLPRLAVIALAAISTAALAAPGDMPAATFLAKANALKAKGPMAMFSSDLSALKAEGQAAGQAYRARLETERAAGHPSSCPPKGTRVNSDDLLAFIGRYPADVRARTPMRGAMADYFARTYPCH